MTETELRFYRQLFLRRYAMLLTKAEHTYSIPHETMEKLRRQILTLDWVDVGVQKIASLPTVRE